MNHQQTQGDFFNPGYATGSLNRSPSSTRPDYATKMVGGRRNQMPLDPIGPPYGEDRFNSMDAGARYERSPYGGFGGANQASWAYNAGAATLNGPINDGSRLRGVARRAPLLSEWTSTPESHPGGQSAQGVLYYAQQHMSGHQLGLANGLGQDSFGMNHSSSLGYPMTPELRQYKDPKSEASDLIPTAIVIKNIPFHYRKEALTDLMVQMNLPQPYAFNYHFDNGVFRGLAFANFQSPADTAIVIESLNNLEVAGRKLRVEYKKMLPEHERERIEREKREKRGQLEEQHRAPTHQVSMSSMASAAAAQRLPPSAGPLPQTFQDLNMNDRQSLQFYTDLFLFSKDLGQEVMIFPSSTSPEHRRVIHILAHHLGLDHNSVGEGANRQIHVSRRSRVPHQPSGHLQQPGVNVDSHPKGLSRAATFDFAEARQHPSLHSASRATLAVPGSPDGQHGIRAAKSFADLRYHSPSPSASTGSNNNFGVPSSGHNSGMYMNHYAGDSPYGHAAGTPTTPGGVMSPSSTAEPPGLVASLGALGLGGSYDVSGSGLGGRGRENNTSNPGAIGSQRPGANGTGSRANPERQPRGPGAGDWDSGFGRSRANGHMQRGSDSSDNTSRIAASGALYQ